jgi:N-acetylglutamate synthase-like GNAT family acetyltransferase
MVTKKPATSVQITKLRLRDVPVLHRLFIVALDSDFTYIDASRRGRIKRQNSRRHLAATLVRPDRIVYLARSGGELVGYIIANFAHPDSGNIDWLYMRPGQRGANTGLKLLSRTMRALMDRGAKTVTLVTYSYTDYYARQGFQTLRKVTSDGIEQDLMRFIL